MQSRGALFYNVKQLDIVVLFSEILLLECLPHFGKKKIQKDVKFGAEICRVKSEVSKLEEKY